MDDGSLGSRLASLRAGLGLSLQNVADGIGISKNTVHKWERDEMVPSGPNVAKLADFLQVEPAYLAYGVVKNKPANRELAEAITLLNKDEAQLVLMLVNKILSPRTEVVTRNGNGKK